MTNSKKAPRVAELANKVCLNGHTGDWVARPTTTKAGLPQGKVYCVSCAREALERHKAKKLGLGSEYVAQTRVRTPVLMSKQQAEERWAKTVLLTASAQIGQAHQRLKELAEMVQEAHDVVQKSSDDELLRLALEEMRKISKIFDEVMN